MSQQADELKARTHRFFMRVITLCEGLPRTAAAARISPQLLDSAGGTDSNYRAACRARSKKEFIAKIGVASEEADESFGWLEALRAARLGDAAEVLALITEADELTRIFVASRKTAQRNLEEENRRAAAEKRRRRG